jgi:hypothetical protein
MVVALALMTVGAVGQRFGAAWAGQPGGGDSQTVAFVAQGALKVQPLRGGAVTPATEMQKTTWRKMQGDGLAPPQTSPNGAYRTTPLTDADRERLGDSGIMVQDGFVLCRTRDGKAVLTPDDILKIAGIEGGTKTQLSIGQWLPDSRHIVVSHFDGIAGSSWIKRFGVDIQAKRLSPFNGWLAPDNRTAIAPAQEREASERTDSKDSSGDRVWTHAGPDFYVVALPPRPETYRFHSAMQGKIMHGGTPLHILLDGRVQFSRDSRYALIEAFKKRYSDRRWYVVDLRNGQVRKLDGPEAVLL